MFGRTRAKIVLFLSTLLISVFIFAHFHRALSSLQSPATAKDTSIEIVKGWQYRWGDFSVEGADAPACQENEISNSCWQQFQFPSRLRKPEDEQIVWLRVPLPTGQWKSPALYLRGVPYIIGAYLNQRLVYTEFSLNSSGKANFESYQWPIIPLGSDFQGEILLFRVYVGDYPSIYIGLFDRVTIGSQIALIKRSFEQEIDAVFGFLVTCLGLSAIFLSLIRKETKSYFRFGLFALSIGLYIISDSDLITLFLNRLIILGYLEYISFYLIPISTCLLFEEIFGVGYKSIIRYLWKINLVYAIIGLLLFATQTDTWISDIYLDQLLLLVTALILLINSIQMSMTGNWEAKLFTSGFIILALSAVHDTLVYILKPLYWYHKIHPWGTFVFILLVGLIFEYRFNQARRRLQDYARELEVKNYDLQEMDKLKDEFLANTSHELKTPLNGIIGIAESLIDGATGKLSQQTISNLYLIVSSGQRLNQLVNDLLDFSQLKHKKLQLTTKAVGMREITNVVLTLCQPLVGSKPLQLINKIGRELPPVDADENRVQQILYNLVGNAIKFTASGTIEVSAIIRDASLANSTSPSSPNQEVSGKGKTQLLPIGSQYLEVTVADTGIGIEADKLERIFQSFEQADGSISREYGGAGLGLAVTKQLVKLHGGDIHAESTPGMGSRFIFTLPLSAGKVEKRLSETVSKISKFSAMATTQKQLLLDGVASAPTEGAFKIMLVDDELVNLQVLINHLSLQNYAITQAANGIEALEIIQHGFQPDLILLDIMMPKMTGYELCKKIREQFPANELPVVLLTAKNQVSDLVEGFGVGANDYLSKPVSKHELLARIKTHLRLAKINAAYGRFVPHEFLNFLDRESIVDVQLGDQVLKEMTVLFADIRSFTTLSEQMSPKENFDFLNAYLSRVSPVIRNHHGFIDKYIGDAIMALFPQSADDALQAGIDMQKQVSLFNSYRQQRGKEPIAIGIGMHTGSLILGTVGESQRMENTVIADAVNLASRLEGLTKVYGADILISEQTLGLLDNQQQYRCRFLGRVKVKGKTQAVGVFEVCDANPQQLMELKMQTLTEFERGVELYVEKKFAQAQQVFKKIWQINQHDLVTKLYIKRCQKAKRFGVSEFDVVVD
ncbi:MAG: response regulator [Symploca sp. SIO3C6]|nr:response regulator [Symploca sp. SIO3C6]